MFNNTLARGLVACLMVFGGAQAFDTLSRTPAFNETLQVETAIGGTRPLAVSSMYSESQYLLQIATGYQGINSVEILGSGGEILPDASVILERMETSRDALIRGLQLAPGDVSSWMALSRAEEALGNRTGAVDAMLATVAIAPVNSDAARQRVLTFVSYAASEGPEWILDHPRLKEALMLDLTTLNEYGRQALKFIELLPDGPEAISWLAGQT